MAFDIKEIQTKVDRVLSYSQEIDTSYLNTDKLMSNWMDAKRDIIESFGGDLIYEVGPMTFTLGKEERAAKITEFISRVERVYGNSSLAWFLYKNAETFFDNLVVNDYILPTGEKIPAGMKLLKSFKFFETNECALKALQTEASMIIQENKIEGVLCFSVHPLDFLSLSENNYNWRSCHALDGEFRSGNLSYMCDKSTFICYLRGKESETFIPRFPDDVKWNSKKWRMLLFLSDSWQSMFAGRQYPFITEAGLEAITPHLRKALKQTESSWSAWHNDMLTSYNYQNGQDVDGPYDFTRKTVIMGQKYYDITDLVEDGKDSKHFNDLLRSSCYVPFYQWNKKRSLARNDKFPSGVGEHFLIGSAAPCIACGTANICLTDAMYCEDCAMDYASDDNENMTTCDCCGNRVWVEDTYQTQDGSWVCDHCAHNECVACWGCGELLFKDDATYDRFSGNYYCDDCYKDLNRERD